MRTTTNCPASHTELASASDGTEYGHVPGHQYLDVDVIITRRGDRFRCQVVEHWGSAQGYDQENGRRVVVGRGNSIAEAVGAARLRAAEAGITCKYLASALSQCEDEAEDALADDEE